MVQGIRRLLKYSDDIFNSVQPKQKAQDLIFIKTHLAHPPSLLPSSTKLLFSLLDIRLTNASLTTE